MKFNAIIITILMTATGWGQSPSESFVRNEDECQRNLSIYYQDLQLGMFLSARTYWLKAYKTCGGTLQATEGFFINGRYIYNELATKTFANDSIHQKEVSDSIAWIYEQHLILAPNPTLELRYADFLMKQGNADYGKITDLFKVVDQLKEATPARYLSLNFKHMLVNIYNNATNEEKLDLKDEILELYFRLTDYANIALEKSATIGEQEVREKSEKEYADSKRYLSKYVVKAIRNPELVQKALERQFSLLPADSLIRSERITEHIDLIQKFGCSTLPVYTKYIYALAQIKPSYTGFMGIAEIENNNADYNKAIAAFINALELALTDEQANKVNYQLALAYYKSNSYKLAFKSAKKVIGENEGKANVICGNCIAALSRNCGESTFERHANYWLANDYYNKAVTAGEEVDRNQFSNQWPNPNECFENGVNMGDVFSLTCWGETSIVR